MTDTMPRQRLAASFWVLVAGSVVYFIAQGMLFPVLPKYIKNELGGSKFDIGFTVGSFALGAMIARPLGGMFADRVGRRAVTVVGSLFWAAMVALYPVAGTHGDIPALIAVRILGGLGGGMLFVAMAAIATDLSPPDRRVQGFGLFSSSTLIGFAIGPPLGLAVLDGRHFARTFTTCAVIAVAPAISMLFMPDTRPAGQRTARPAIWASLFHPAARRLGLSLLLGGLSYVTFVGFLPDYADEVGLERVGIALTLNSVANLVVARLRGADRRSVRTAPRRRSVAALHRHRRADVGAVGRTSRHLHGSGTERRGQRLPVCELPRDDRRSCRRFRARAGNRFADGLQRHRHQRRRRAARLRRHDGELPRRLCRGGVLAACAFVNTIFTGRKVVPAA